LSLHKPLKTGKIPSLPEVKNGNRQDIKYVLNNIGISSHQIQGSAEGEWVKSEYNVQSLNLIEIPVDVQLVPDVKGMGLRDALYLLENRGLKVQVQGYGHVVYQSLLANSKVVKGATILLQLQP
jgi:cell division protein FtsI (penicillin-binding protein 3)